MDRVTTLSQQTRLLSFVGETQRRFDDLQTQIASGRKAQNYQGVARESGRLITLESTHLKVTQYVDGNGAVERRLGTMESSLAQLIDVVTSFRTLLVNALNGSNAADLDLNNQAQQYLNEAAALLNVRQDGRYLFSGSRTDEAPVDLAALPASYTIPTADGASGAYYQGNTQLMEVRADDLLTVSYGVLASDPAFERAIRAVDIVVNGAPTDRTMLNHALDVVSQALDGLPDVRTRIGLDRKTLESVNGRHQEFLLFAEQNISDIENVDIPETVTRLNEAQVTLEASYLTLSRLSQTTLMNFLR
jgi:flagellar hook-associated protein 3 FlgL